MMSQLYKKCKICTIQPIENFRQLDHIVPHSTFKYMSIIDKEFKECWALKNLRPLEAKQNMLDGANRTRHNLKISDLETMHNIK